jgi:hypothetical protein
MEDGINDIQGDKSTNLSTHISIQVEQNTGLRFESGVQYLFK